MYPGDAGILLTWTGGRPAGRTCEGMALAEAMSGFGMVDHAVWETVAPEGAEQAEKACDCGAADRGTAG
jgi:hypothetical protein